MWLQVEVLPLAGSFLLYSKRYVLRVCPKSISWHQIAVFLVEPCGHKTFLQLLPLQWTLSRSSLPAWRMYQKIYCSLGCSILQISFLLGSELTVNSNSFSCSFLVISSWLQTLPSFRGETTMLGWWVVLSHSQIHSQGRAFTPILPPRNN